jgi:hypothetical protein
MYWELCMCNSTAIPALSHMLYVSTMVCLSTVSHFKMADAQEQLVHVKFCVCEREGERSFLNSHTMLQQHSNGF